MGRPELDNLSQRELEELETRTIREVVSGHDIDVSIFACKVKDYYEALRAQGFSDEDAITLVGTTIGYLLR